MTMLGTVQGLAERRGVAFDPTDKRAIRALEDASAFIRNYTGQLFDAVTDDEITREGSGRYRLLLPELPVTAVTEVTEVDCEGVETALETTTYRADAYGMLRRMDGCVWWLDHDYAITYDHGYETVPADIAAACYVLAEENYIQTGTGAVTSVQIGNFQESYDASTTATADLPLSVKATLDHYRYPK